MLELLTAYERRGIISGFQDMFLEDALRIAVFSEPMSMGSWSPLSLLGNLLSI